MMVSRFIAASLLCLPLSLARAQSWNGPDVQALVARAIARRATVQADSGLRSFRARAHGFVFFLGQLGEGFREPPRLIKSDQLELEVYWRAPGLSKQIIIGRRDRRDLPTDIQYHRDHLGIVQNNFGDSIRLGEGDEVRDVPHPLSAAGPTLYDYALTDSLTIELPDRAVRVYRVDVRPRAFDAPRLAGAIYLDVEQAEPVRFQFNFTPAAYLDNTVEDITVVLDNGLWFGKYWLPRRQEIEIRRRSSWLDLPARGIIRGRWEIGTYEFNPVIPPGTFAPGAPEIVSIPIPARDTFHWNAPLADEIRRVAGPVEAADLESVRATIAAVVGRHVLASLPGSTPSFGSLSDILHVNRVQGLTFGAGWRVRPGVHRVVVSGAAGFGVADHRFTARLAISRPAGAWTWELRGAREVRDIGDEPVISGAQNSILAQERGVDFGDYVLLHVASLSVSRRVGPLGGVRFTAGAERPSSVGLAARPATGQYRLNPALGGELRGVTRLVLEHEGAALSGSASLSGRVLVEAGATRTSRYVRGLASGSLRVAAGNTEVALDARGGWGSAGLPLDRGFVLGGRGTLPGEPVRAWGGRDIALARVEWRFPVPFPGLPLGAFGTTGNRATLAPFLAVGGAGGAMPGVPWLPTSNARSSAGVAIELFHGLLRIEGGASLRGGRPEWSVDIRRDLWSIM
ncbi:MAG: hypothetical protein EXR93_04750 [Gemmatimonadetes bacterium]|nr:hypothetical protein [Gemmatimonadota bacterium]